MGGPAQDTGPARQVMVTKKGENKMEEAAKIVVYSFLATVMWLCGFWAAGDSDSAFIPGIVIAVAMIVFLVGVISLVFGALGCLV